MEEERGISAPATVATTGQKVAGVILRVFGVLVFLGAGCYFSLFFIALILSAARPVGTDEWLLIVGSSLGCLLGQFLGSLMAIFGLLLRGGTKPRDGLALIRWMATMVGRDISLFLGIVGSVLTPCAFILVKGAGQGLIVLVVAGFFLGLASFLTGRLGRC